MLLTIKKTVPCIQIKRECCCTFREDRWVRHTLKQLPLQENIIPLSQHLFCKWSKNLSSRPGGRRAGQQLPGRLAYALVLAGEFPLWPVEHQPRGVSAFVASRHQCCLSPAGPQKAPKSHYWYHDAIHKALGARETGRFSAPSTTWLWENHFIFLFLKPSAKMKSFSRISNFPSVPQNPCISGDFSEATKKGPQGTAPRPPT